jgi:hypothetical protein
MSERRHQMNDDAFVDELCGMNDEQLAMIDRLANMAVEYGLSPDEFASLWETVFAACESGKSADETVAIVMGKH